MAARKLGRVSFFEHLTKTCPQLIGREFYLSVKRSVPERKFILLSGGKIKDGHTDIIFDNRLDWLKSLVDTVPEIKALKENQSDLLRISLANLSYTLPGRSGWRLDKIMTYIRIKEDKTIDAEMFFQPHTQGGRSTKSVKQSQRTSKSMKKKQKTVPKKRRFCSFFKDLAEACPQLVGREFYLSFKPSVPECKFVLLSGGKIKDCHTDRIFATKKGWLESLVDTVPEIKALGECHTNFANTSVFNFCFTRPNRSGWRLSKVMRHVRVNKNKTINADKFFQPPPKRGRKKKVMPPQDSGDTDSTKKPEHTAESSKEQEKTDVHQKTFSNFLLIQSRKRNTASMKKPEHTAESNKDQEKTEVHKKTSSNFFEDLAEACPQMIGREFYLSFNRSVPERKFVLLSGGKIKDGHTDIVFDNRLEWLKSLVDTVPEIKALKEQQTSTSSFMKISLANVSHTLPGRCGWRLREVMKYIRMNQDKTIDAEMFFQPCRLKGGHKNKAMPPQDSGDTNPMKKPEHTAESSKGQEKTEVHKRTFTNFFKDLAEACPQMIGREFYLSFKPSVPERKFVLLSEGKIKDCHTDIVFDSRLKWLKSLVDTVPEIKALKEQQTTTSSFMKISLANLSYTLPGRSGWRLNKIMRYITINQDKTIDAEMFFQPFTLKGGLKKKAKPPQGSCATASTTKPKHTAGPVKEKEKNASDILRQLVNRVEDEEYEMHQTNVDPDILEMHSYASTSQASSSSCSEPTTPAEGMWFKEGESLSPEELVLYGLLLVKGKHPAQRRLNKNTVQLDCFTAQAGNNGEFTPVATAANRVSAASKYSEEGIKTYLFLAPQQVGRYKGKIRWEFFLSEVQHFVEKQGRNLSLLLSGANDIDVQGIRDAAANICEENSVHQASPCPSNTALTFQSLQEVWKDELRDQWNNCHLTCSESEAVIHFLSPSDSSSPVLQRTLHIHQDMTWTLKVRGLTCTREQWGDLPWTVSHISLFRTVLQFVQEGFVCLGCDYDKFSEVMDRTVVADAKVETFGELKCIRSEQCVLFSSYPIKRKGKRGLIDYTNMCSMCRKKNDDLVAVLNWLNDHKAKGTIASSTTSKFIPRETLEQQVIKTKMELTALQKKQEECNNTNKILRQRLNETMEELATSQEKLERIKPQGRQLLVTRKELATLEKEVLNRRRVMVPIAKIGTDPAKLQIGQTSLDQCEEMSAD